MNDSTPSLEDLLERRTPSAIARHDEALAAAGIADADVAATKNALAAAAIASTAPADPPPSLRDRILATQKRGGRYGIFADRIARLFDLSLADAEELMARIEKPSEWTAFLVDGLELIPVVAGPKCSGAIATLVRIQPGARFPDHAHRGDETMLVLDGGFREPGEGGEEAWRGDEMFRPDGTEHALLALPGEPCVAAVLIHGHADIR